MIIFGAGGQLGYAFSRIFPDAHCFSHSEIDIADAVAVEKVFSDIRPRVVINTAAYPNAENAELDDTLEAYRVNVLGAIVLARLAKKYQSVLVHFSTDYVFDGETEDGFIETDTPRPRNIHGLSKLASEEAVRAYLNEHYLIRTSALFGPREGSFGRNFVTKRIEQALAKEPIRMVNDQWTVPTYTFDVANAVKVMLEKNVPFGTYHMVGGGGGATWYEFAKEVCASAHFEADITPVSTDVSASRLFRPRRSVLRDTKLSPYGISLPPWRDSLKDFITTYNK
jgi:dTDP-4-dehydrorhamnose reductase